LAGRAELDSARADIPKLKLPKSSTNPGGFMTTVFEAQITQEKSNSYVARHWRGEVSLGRAYWLDGHVIFGIAINAFAVITGSVLLIALNGVPVLALSMAAPVLAFQLAGYIWAVVGIWRAANTYTGKKAWAVLAKIQMVVSAIISFFILVAEVGQLCEFATDRFGL
jgi:hypothetical protein